MFQLVRPVPPGPGLEEKALRRLRKAMQHMLNPLHVYCRLKDIGVSGPLAHRMCQVYERFVFRLLP